MYIYVPLLPQRARRLVDVAPRLGDGARWRESWADGPALRKFRVDALAANTARYTGTLAPLPAADPQAQCNVQRPLVGWEAWDNIRGFAAGASFHGRRLVGEARFGPRRAPQKAATGRREFRWIKGGLGVRELEYGFANCNTEASHDPFRRIA